MMLRSTDHYIAMLIEGALRPAARAGTVQAVGPLSDIDLLKCLLPRRVGSARVALLAELAAVLRLMHSFLAGDETGEAFIEKFTNAWLRIDGWSADPALDSATEYLDEYYERLQFFAPRGQPPLYGRQELQSITRIAHQRLRDVWLDAVRSDLLATKTSASAAEQAETAANGSVRTLTSRAAP